MSTVVSIRVIVSDMETEVLVSDTAIDAFGIEIRSHGRGIWHFSDEERLRDSVPPQLWWRSRHVASSRNGRCRSPRARSRGSLNGMDAKKAPANDAAARPQLGSSYC